MVAFLRKSIFKIFRKTAAIFSILKILIFFSGHLIELKIPHHMKGKPTEYVYLLKNCIILENILAVFYEIVRSSSRAHHSWKKKFQPNGETRVPSFWVQKNSFMPKYSDNLMQTSLHDLKWNQSLYVKPISQSVEPPKLAVFTHFDYTKNFSWI